MEQNSGDPVDDMIRVEKERYDKLNKAYGDMLKRYNISSSEANKNLQVSRDYNAELTKKLENAEKQVKELKVAISILRNTDKYDGFGTQDALSREKHFFEERI